MDFVATVEIAVSSVDDPLDLNVAKDVSQKIEFGSARQAVMLGDIPDRAIVERQQVRTVFQRRPSGQVALGIEQFAETVKPFFDRQAFECLSERSSPALFTAVEQPLDESWVFGFEIFKQFEGKRVVPGRKERIATRCGMVEIDRASRTPTGRSGFDQPSDPEASQVLAHCAGGDVESRGKVIGARFAVFLERDEDVSACGRQTVRGGLELVHGPHPSHLRRVPVD